MHQDIETGDIILVKGSGIFVSPLIRWFTGSPYTHVGIAVGPYQIFEIDVFKEMDVHFNWHKEYDVFRLKEGLTEETKEGLYEHMIAYKGRPRKYDWFRILQFGLRKLIGFPVILDHVDRYVCSEITDVLYYKAGVNLLPDMKKGNVVPGDFEHSPLLEKISLDEARQFPD